MNSCVAGRNPAVSHAGAISALLVSSRSAEPLSEPSELKARPVEQPVRFELRSAIGILTSSRKFTEVCVTGPKRLLILAPLVIVILCVTQRFTVNGKCGATNGVAVSVAPIVNLCEFGTASAVKGSGRWRWNCIGWGGGSSASCSAPIESAGGAATASGVAAGPPKGLSWNARCR